MDQQNFNYQGWNFRHETDGSLIIEPGNSSESSVFGEPKKQQQMQSITLPKEEVHRLLGYCISGSLDNTEVIQKVKELETQYGLVGGGTR